MAHIPIGPERGGQITTPTPRQEQVINRLGFNLGSGFKSNTSFDVAQDNRGPGDGLDLAVAVAKTTAGERERKQRQREEAESKRARQQEQVNYLSALEERRDFDAWEESWLEECGRLQGRSAINGLPAQARQWDEEVERRQAGVTDAQTRANLTVIYGRNRAWTAGRLTEQMDKQLAAWTAQNFEAEMADMLKHLDSTPGDWPGAVEHSAFLIDTFYPDQDNRLRKNEAAKSIFSRSVSSAGLAGRQEQGQSLLEEADRYAAFSPEDKAAIHGDYQAALARSRSEERAMGELLGEALLARGRDELTEILRNGPADEALGRNLKTAEARGFLPAGSWSGHQKERAAAQEAARWLKSPENYEKSLPELLSLAEEKFGRAEGDASGVGRLVMAELAERQEKLKADPLGYVEEQSQAVMKRLTADGFLPSGGPEIVQARVEVGRLVARQMGLKDVPQVLSQKEADACRRQLENIQDPAERLQLLSGLANDYGPHSEALFKQLEIPAEQRLALKLAQNQDPGIRRQAEKTFRYLGRRPDQGRPGQIQAANRARAEANTSEYSRRRKVDILAEQGSPESFRELGGFYDLCVATVLESQDAGREPENSLKTLLSALKEGH